MADINFGAGVAERDIDLLLLEEFYTSKEFRDWFIGQINQPKFKNLEFIWAGHSVTYFNGESDLVLKFKGIDAKEYWLLIENKIAAPFQPDQIKRYFERARKYEAEGLCHLACPILVAPKDYIRDDFIGQERFIAKVTYQAIQEWFEGNYSNDPIRGEYKVALLAIAITPRGVIPPLPPVYEFWLRYIATVNQLHPELNFRPNPPSGGGNFWHFYPECLQGLKFRNSVVLVHKLYAISNKGGSIDLEFQGMGDKLDVLTTLFDPHIDKKMGMKIVKRGKSGAIIIEVPKIINVEDFSINEEKVVGAIETVWKMAEWFKKHRDTWNNYWEQQT